MAEMSRGRNNKLAGQIGEFLVCAELGRRGIIATPFSGNVPVFDILAIDDAYNPLPIQVKSTRTNNWPTDARNWMVLDLHPEERFQIYREPQKIENPDFIYVHVVIAGINGQDRFYILTKAQLQQVVIKRYSAWMDSIGWRRPKNQESYECRYQVQDLEAYHDHWALITDRARPSPAPRDCR